MSIAPTSVSALTSALVHHSAVAPQICRHHATFIAKRLAISFGALAVAPFFLAFRGAPSAGEILVFACSFAPLAAAMLAARTGRLVAAHGVAALGLIALALSLWLGLGGGTGCALAWIATALLEAMLSGNRRLTTCVGAAAGMALLVLGVATLAGSAVPTSPSSIPAGFIALAAAYAAIVATGSRPLAWARAAVAQPQHSEEPRATAKSETELWRTITELLDDAIVVLDAGGTVLEVAADNAAHLGTTLLGRGLFERVHVADRPLFLQHVADAAYGEPTTPARLRLRAADVGVELAPTHLWFELRTKATASNQVVALLRETADRQVEDCRIAAAQRAAEEAIEAKDRFFANMSHELRTPLNAIIGFSEMLASRTLRPTDADKQREYARIINQSGQHLLSVVNATLDISKIRSGTFVLAVEPFDIAPLVDQCCEMVALKAHEGRVRIVKDDAAEPFEVTGDKRACRQILVNLLSNAVKFTPAGGEVRVSTQIDNDSLCLSVTDTGIGMEAADLARLGDPFFQINPIIGRAFEGTGLGLSVVRGLVGLLGGTIAIASEPGHGTRVDVRLPLDGRTETRQPSSAPIETIPHHSTCDLPRARLDRRMKQSA